MSKQEKNKKVDRAPVVVVLGHVDHGKSSLLEAVKDFQILSQEAGGITQHIGAYMVDYNAHNLSFIATPGPAAFFCDAFAWY